MHEFAALGNLQMWYLHMDVAGMKARWGGDLNRKELKTLSANLAHASHRDNHRALEKLTRRVHGQIKIAPNPPLIVPIEDLLPGPEQDSIGETMRGLIHKYTLTLPGGYRKLIESYRFVHLARKVVGVGSVGTHAWIILLLGRDEQDALVLQVKEAQDSVLEPYLGKSVYGNHGRRVVEGQWLMQSSSDVFLGWNEAVGFDGVKRVIFMFASCGIGKFHWISKRWIQLRRWFMANCVPGHSLVPMLVRATPLPSARILERVIKYTRQWLSLRQPMPIRMNGITSP